MKTERHAFATRSSRHLALPEEQRWETYPLSTSGSTSARQQRRSARSTPYFAQPAAHVVRAARRAPGRKRPRGTQLCSRGCSPRAGIRLALTGSGAAPIADKLGVPFVQEVVANACAVQALYPRTRCAIELGGQDAKMIFFRANETTGALDVADMRMNGSCAGGTGAFIDEIASVLNLPIEQFDAAACRGRTVYDISGRCGVYAKTDIQPLLNQGASRDDLALSAFHAIAKQTLGGLAQGIDVCPPIIFEGGPLTFNPALISVFKGATQPQRRPGHRPRAP